MKTLLTLLLTLFILHSASIFACTSAVISGKCTPDGRPLLWKNRDTGTPQNAIMFFADGKYDYLGLINSDDIEGQQIWAGYNSTGFAIMNTASYNLIEQDTIEAIDREGFIMKMALQHCKTLADFEKMLDTLQKPLGVEANFGVIDAQGGAAYYETDNFKYKKIDVNDPIVAPFGYVIRSNYSFTGQHDAGYGYIRYLAAEELIYNAVAENKLTVKYIQQKMSRCLKHALTKEDLRKAATDNPDESKFVFFEDFIPRYTSSASVVIQGIKKDESPEFTTMWTVLGFPLTSVLTPVWITGAKQLPEIVTLNKDSVSSLCDNVLKLRDKVFPIKRGSGKRYMNINALYKINGKGIMQQNRITEDVVFAETQKRLEAWQKEKKMDKKKVIEYYTWLNQFVKDAFYENYNLKF